MKLDILSLLQCPRCATRLEITPFCIARDEIRSGVLMCKGPQEHVYEIEEGIIRFETGFDHEAVQRELEYENSTYHGDGALRDAQVIARFPDTLPDLWPHTRHFGPDFRHLMEAMALPPGSWVLDVGTGPCWSSRLLAQRGYKVVALDVNDANFYGLKTADILFDAHQVYFERVLESMTHLPFRNSCLDAITFNASFHHTPDQVRTLAECFRVLKPYGVVAMVNEEFWSLRQKLFRRHPVTDTGSHHAVDYGDFQREAAREGFSVEYRVTAHVRQQLAARFGVANGTRLVRLLEAFPPALQQLNSALVLLRKPAVPRSTPGPTARLARV